MAADVQVIELATMNPDCAQRFLGPFIVVDSDGKTIEELNEDAAFRYQRGRRLLSGLRAMTGEPFSAPETNGGHHPMDVLTCLWEMLGEVPVSDEGYLKEPFLKFERGTHCETIWHWFEAQNPAFIVGEVQSGLGPKLSIARRLELVGSPA